MFVFLFSQKVITIVTTDQADVGNGEEPVLVTVNADGSTDGTLTVEATGNFSIYYFVIS